MKIKDSDRVTCQHCQEQVVMAIALPEGHLVPIDAEPDLSGSVRLDYFDNKLTAQVVPHFEREQTTATYGPLYRRHSVLCGTSAPTAEGS